MSLGGKLLAAKHVTVRKIPRSGKYLKVANIWHSKKLQLVSESEQKYRRDCDLFLIKNLNKRHEDKQTFVLAKVIAM